MRLRDGRLWSLLLALAFLVLWCVSVRSAYTAPAQELFAEPLEAEVAAESLSAVGIWGWLLVGVGALVVLCAVIACNLPPRRGRRRSYRRPRSMKRRY